VSKAPLARQFAPTLPRRDSHDSPCTLSFDTFNHSLPQSFSLRLRKGTLPSPRCLESNVLAALTGDTAFKAHGLVGCCRNCGSKHSFTRNRDFLCRALLRIQDVVDTRDRIIDEN